MNDKIYNLSKDFMTVHEELSEGVLASIESIALKNNDADAIKKLKDLEETARFLMVDFGEYNKILEELKAYVQK